MTFFPPDRIVTIDIICNMAHSTISKVLCLIQIQLAKKCRMKYMIIRCVGQTFWNEGNGIIVCVYFYKIIHCDELQIKDIAQITDNGLWLMAASAVSELFSLLYK